MKVKKSAEFYITGKAEIQVNFPDGDICCHWCPMCTYYEGMRRYRCILTDEHLVYPFESVGIRCPWEEDFSEVKKDG